MTQPRSRTRAERAQYDKYVDLVLEGGGVRGIGLVGAYSVLEERGYQVQNIAGNSAGAVVGSLIAAGYQGEELRKTVLEFDYRKLMDRGWEDRVFAVGTPISILLDLGLYEGNVFLEEMSRLLGAHRITTFKDLLYEGSADNKNDPTYRHKLQVIASDVTTRTLLVLPRDAEKIGIAPDDLNVARAVRMSMSIPIFFEPVRWPNPRTSREHIIVDGGLLSNFPVWLFDSDEAPNWPTFGLRLVEENLRSPMTQQLPAASTLNSSKIGTLVDYLKGLVQTMVEAHDRLHIQMADFARTIPIPTRGVSGTDFNLTQQQAESLYDSGRQAATSFLNDWEAGGGWEGYLAAFRNAPPRSRRELVVAEMQRATGS